MLFRGNELKKLFEMNDLDYCNAENELIFGRKQRQIEPQNRNKQPLHVFDPNPRRRRDPRKRRANGKRSYLEGTN
jgi:hypothetical protein